MVTDLALPRVRTSDIAEVASRDAFVRWSVPADSAVGCWAVGSSVAIVHERAPRPMLPTPWAVLLGRPDELGPLVDALPGLLGGPPAGVTMSARAYGLVPAHWRLALRGHWDYMVHTGGSLPEPRADVPVEVVDDPTEVDAVLDADNADAHARPGDADVHTWLGIRDAHGLVCVGALAITPGGGGHLRAVTTLQRARGRGYGARLSAALTRRALELVSPEVTLGVYSDNADAIRLYERLGYRPVHHFTSAAVSDRPDDRDMCT